MKKIKTPLLTIFPLIVSSSFVLVQCNNKNNKKVNKIFNEIKNFELTSNAKTIDKSVFDELLNIKKQNLKHFVKKEQEEHISTFLKLLIMVKNSNINEKKLPKNIFNFKNKINLFVEITSSMVNSNYFLKNKVIEDFLNEYWNLRNSFSAKFIHDENSFNEIVKNAIILAKKIRKEYLKFWLNASDEKKQLFKSNFSHIKIINNEIINNDLDNLLNIEPKQKDPEIKPDYPKPNPEIPKRSWIDRRSNKLILNEYSYDFSKNFKAMFATRVTTITKKDGDTTIFQSKISNEKITCRYSGVDTPETWKKVNNQFVPTEGEQFKYGTMAKNFTSKNLEEAKEIWLIPQKTKSKVNDETKKDYFDHYGRMVGIVVIINQKDEVYCLNELLIFNGLAKVSFISLDKNSIYYTINENYYKWINNSQKNARANKRGVWGASDIKKIYPKH